MVRGPGNNRRFSGKDFVLAETYRAGAVKGTMTYEQRQKEAQFKASMLRKSGMNARIVNGSGWTAIYIGVPTPGKTIPGLKPKKPAKVAVVPKAVEDKFPTVTIPTLDWNQELGITAVKPQIKMKPEDRRKSVLFKGMTDLMLKKDNYFDNNGLGRIYPIVEIKEDSKVTDWKILDTTAGEGADIIDSMTRQQGAESFRSWVEAAGRNQERDSWTEKRDSLKVLSKIFVGSSGNVKQSDLDPSSSKMLVVWIDGLPAYWSPSVSAYSKQLQDLSKATNTETKESKPRIAGLDRSDESQTKGMLGFKGWDNFSPTGRRD